ncbi:hypothetical protein RIF29_09136 [Crotalaria pallida]|uniref:Uncharacterized protein n=1 Tax=Crotalaria pallida TaxID=3830 RepID=A0AAN9FU84_CROPI
MALGKPAVAATGSPNEQNHADSIPAKLAGEGSEMENIEEQTHGEWLVVTRKKRSKPKNQRGVIANDKDRGRPSNIETRAKSVTLAEGADVEKSADNVFIRSSGKRSRQEGKHATPTHVLLRNAGFKDVNKEGESTSKQAPRGFFIQPGNFGAAVPNLKKDMEVMPSILEEDAGVNSFKATLSMDFVPETQFAFDPGQTKFNPNAFT